MDKDNIILRELTTEQKEKAYKSYEKLVEKYKAEGYSFNKLSKSEYLTVRSGVLTESYKRGYRNKSVNRDIVEKQATGVSVPQAKAFAKTMKGKLEEIERPWMEPIFEKAKEKFPFDIKAQERYIRREKAKILDKIKEAVATEGLGEFETVDYDELKALTNPKYIREQGQEAIQDIAKMLDLSSAYYQKKREFAAMGYDIRTANRLAREFISREYFGSP